MADVDRPRAPDQKPAGGPLADRGGPRGRFPVDAASRVYAAAYAASRGAGIGPDQSNVDARKALECFIVAHRESA